MKLSWTSYIGLILGHLIFRPALRSEICFVRGTKFKRSSNLCLLWSGVCRCNDQNPLHCKEKTTIKLFSLRQEIGRMQKILSLVRETLTDLKLAIEGTIIMSENLKSSLDSMYDAR